MQAIHYSRVKDTYKKVPVVIAVGPSETGKTLMAKMAASVIGLPHAFYGRATPAMMTHLLSEALFFVLNDPDITSKDTVNALKVAISQVSSKH